MKKPGRVWSGIGGQPKSRVPYLDREGLPENQRHLLDRPINLFRGLANSPGALSVHHGFAEWIRWDCELDPRLRQLLIVAIGYLSKNPYEYSHHVKISREFGVTSTDINELTNHLDFKNTDHFDASEQAALEASRELLEDGTVSDATWDEIQRHFSVQDATEIVVVASFYCYVVRVLSALRLEVEPEWAASLDEFPLDRE